MMTRRKFERRIILRTLIADAIALAILSLVGVAAALIVKGQP